jgi:phosphatidylserine/phosphatidylglycerophosphate/cardiolipin synthase-like enzyme
MKPRKKGKPNGERRTEAVSARPSHAARVDSSQRLRTLLSALLKAGDRGLTTRELIDSTGSCAPHSDVAELRSNGYTVVCSFAGLSGEGRRVHRYTIGARRAES